MKNITNKEEMTMTDPKSPIFDTLYCQEQEEQDHQSIANSSHLSFTEKDLSWDEDELSNLLAKEEGCGIVETLIEEESCVGLGRREAVEWMIRVYGYYGFNVVTLILAMNYLDRFLCGFVCQREKKEPWMIQLVAVSCLSLAAKVEETHVPLLIDLQVEESKYVFEAKTIQRMEILVLSTLGWKMNPVTPYSFIDYMTRRLGLEDPLCWEFLRRCERVLVSLLPDYRIMRYLPSVIAAAVIVHVFNSLEHFTGNEYQNQLLDILGCNKDKVEECTQLILESALEGKILLSSKRKPLTMPGSPNGVIGVLFSSDSSNESWTVASLVSSSPEPLSKKIRTEDCQSARFIHLCMDFSSIPR